MATLTEFSAQIRKDNVARPYLFFVEIALPPILTKKIMGSKTDPVELDTIRLVNLMCHGASTPFTTLVSSDQYWEAGIKKNPIYSYGLQPFVCQFYVDGKYETKKFFDIWRKAINVNKLHFEYPAFYTSEFIKVHTIDMKSNIVYTYSYNKVFPKTIHTIELSNNGNGAATFGVEFIFETISHGSSAPINNTTIKQDTGVTSTGTKSGGNPDGSGDAGEGSDIPNILTSAGEELNKELQQAFNLSGATELTGMLSKLDSNDMSFESLTSLSNSMNMYDIINETWADAASDLSSFLG